MKVKLSEKEIKLLEEVANECGTTLEAELSMAIVAWNMRVMRKEEFKATINSEQD